MSSPTRNRSILSPKHSNISSPSPKKNKVENPFNSRIKLTYPKSVKSSPSPKKPKLSFTIFEDKIEQITTEPIEEATSNKLNHNDQENILQPKKTINQLRNRKPLSNLSILEYPGYVTFNKNLQTQLTELYQPKNYENEFKSLHKHSSLPNYLTPPRSVRHKYLSYSNVEDDLEINLIKKSNVIRHRRSLSVGRNDAKLHLIRKNTFDVLSN